MPTIDRTKFFDGYRRPIGALHTDLVTAINTRYGPGTAPGKALGDCFVKAQMPHGREARTSINGHAQADKIALLGRQFDALLSISLLPSAA